MGVVRSQRRLHRRRNSEVYLIRQGLHHHLLSMSFGVSLTRGHQLFSLECMEQEKRRWL